MGIFDTFSDFLKGPVGNGLANDPADVRNAKRNMRSLGHFNDETENDFITREMDSGIRNFQREKSLHVDGIMFPGGETERTIFQTLEQRNPDAYFTRESDVGGRIGFGGTVSGMLEDMPRESKKPMIFPAEMLDLYGNGDFDSTVNRAAAAKQPAKSAPPATPPMPGRKPVQSVDATGRRIRDNAPPVPQRKPETIEPTRKGNELLDFIGKLESSDNYNSVYGGKERPLTKMTVKEVQKLQKEMDDKGIPSTAIGRYQIKDDTLKETVNKLGIDENALFDKKLQDKLARSLMERRGFEKYKAGKISTEALIKELAKEWAALPPDASNKSRYEGVLNNRALTRFEILKALLEKR